MQKITFEYGELFAHPWTLLSSGEKESMLTGEWSISFHVENASSCERRLSHFQIEATSG